ncbi:putative F-box protein At1g32420 [Nymphaea colorata]|uniref:putative F-box protein At1g32420 n=1 Tax=Nymphaea colorata TaxID=210225 RepID=UPI00129E9EBC|nr:putative F-box protein At1g32420 [Nymphaea colorata]
MDDSQGKETRPASMEDQEISSSSIATTVAVPTIPTDITITILSKLPVKSLLRFRCVSRDWRAMIDSKRLIELQLDEVKRKKNLSFVVETTKELHFFDANDMLFHLRKDELWLGVPAPPQGSVQSETRLSVLSWCDGLCCLAANVSLITGGRCPIIYQIANPCTRSSVKLPESHLSKPTICQIVRDSVSGAYKLLVIEKHPDFSCEILTIGTNVSWRKLAGAYGSDQPLLQMAAVCGATHWIYRPNFYSTTLHAAEDSSALIVAFDIGDETFRTIPYPLRVLPDENLDFVAEFRGSLCLLHFDVADQKMEFWVLKDYASSVWSRHHSVRFELLRRTVDCCSMRAAYMGTTGDEKIVFMVRLMERPDEDDHEVYIFAFYLWEELTISYCPDRRTFRLEKRRVAEDLKSELSLGIETLACVGHDATEVKTPHDFL